MSVQTISVDASPVKRFFIDIITRDIGLMAAILDLVDNAVDSARGLRDNGDLSGLRVGIALTSEHFSIQDNCSGIDPNSARDFVFRMGRPDDVEASPGSIGQFGVGLKRALFKLGRIFEIKSSTRKNSLSINLDVDKWVVTDDWSFPMVVEEGGASVAGTAIVVRRLNSLAAEAFTRHTFLEELREELRSRHRLAVGNGLQISLNDVPVAQAESSVAASSLMAPAIRSFTIENHGAGPISVRIVAGVSSTLSGDIDEDGEPEAQSKAASDAGWLVFGNNRLLLASDKSSITGWGSGRNRMPQYHNQYSRFRGFVYLSSTDASAIPWNTMKTGVDSDSAAWDTIRDAMISAGREIITLLNFAKAERQSGVIGSTPILDALRDARAKDVREAVSEAEASYSMSITELRGGVVVAAYYPSPGPSAEVNLKKIQYRVGAEAFDEIVEATGNSNAAEIGRLSFDEYYANHIRA